MPKTAAEPFEDIWANLPLSREAFIKRVWSEGSAHERQLPWRYIDDPYAVLVSEVMLQQTQVKRVLSYWSRWMEMFPTLDALASASTADVLSAWQGLGYNRRGLALKRLADECSACLEGHLPADADQLLKLPGVGPATAAGVMAFAYNVPGVYLETNVRSVFIHELFPDRDGVTDKELVPLVADACSKDDPRRWYYALLDFGAYLKSSGYNPSRQSAHYTRQSTFEGSRRQKRAELLRIVLDDDGITPDQARANLNALEQKNKRPEVDEALFTSIMRDLVDEGFFAERDGRLYPA